jgi:hypothetical protein
LLSRSNSEPTFQGPPYRDDRGGLEERRAITQRLPELWNLRPLVSRNPAMSPMTNSSRIHSMLLTGWLDKTLGIYFANGCGGATAFRSAYKSKGSSGHCVIEAIRLLESRPPGLDNLTCRMKVGRERADAWLSTNFNRLGQQSTVDIVGKYL